MEKIYSVESNLNGQDSQANWHEYWVSIWWRKNFKQKDGYDNTLDSSLLFQVNDRGVSIEGAT